MKSNRDTMGIKVLKVEGMTCNHCKNNVESNLEKLSFVEKARVDLGAKTVTLEGENIELETAKSLIASLGYKPK